MKKLVKRFISIFMKTKEEQNKEFILNILHDIKSPIAGINIALENLDTKKISANEILKEIYKVNKHNLEYIENLMENYSFESGKYQVKYEYFNLINLLNEEIYALRFLIIEKNLKLNLISTNESILVYTDRQMVRRIFLNLLTNAVKYSPSTEEVRVEVSKNKSRVSVCITNTICSHTIKDPKISTGFGQEIIREAMTKLSGKIYHTKNKNKICFHLELKG